MTRTLAAACAAVLIAACGGAPQVVQHFDPQSYPAQLSAWGVIDVDDNRLKLANGFIPYDLNTPLFSDYAHKLRALWLPPDTPARYDDTGVFDMPVGTIIAKTFYFPRADKPEGALLRTEDNSRDFSGEGLDLRSVRLIETRLLVRQEHGWDALVYVWDDAQQHARLEIAGDIKQLSFAGPDGAKQAGNYVIPTRNECANCHATDHGSRKLQPIGIAARHLNKRYDHYADGSAPQLQRWVERGYLDRVAADAPSQRIVARRRRRRPRAPRTVVSRHQLRPLPQPRGRSRHIRAVPLRRRDVAAPPRRLQAADRRRARHRRPAGIDRARQPRRVDPDLPRQCHRPRHDDAGAWPHHGARGGCCAAAALDRIVTRRLRLRQPPDHRRAAPLGKCLSSSAARLSSLIGLGR